MIRKTTQGYVSQTFTDDGTLVHQSFIADTIDPEAIIYNGDDNQELVLDELEKSLIYHPYAMEQPK